MGTSIVISSAFDMPQIPMIIALGLVVTVLSMLGGRWAVAASDFIQSILIATITFVAAFMVIYKMGGLAEFWSSVPDLNKTLFHGPEIKYDTYWLLVNFLLMLVMFNSIDEAVRYVAVKDSKSASKAAFMASGGFTIFPLLFFVPPLAAHALIPDLAEKFSSFANPSEASYIAVCMEVLPQGMLGLLVAAIFAATMSSVDTGLNQLSGIFVKNFYNPVLRPHADEKELLKVGFMVTAALGVFGVLLAIYLSLKDDLPLFEVYMMMNSYINLPMAIPLLMGMFVKRAPSWIPIPVILCGILFAIFFYNILPMKSVSTVASSIFGNAFIEYLIAHKFVGANFFNIVFTVSIYLLAAKFAKHDDQEYNNRVDAFLKRMKTPVDFDKEVGGDSSGRQCNMMGGFSFAYGVVLLLCMAIPNPIEGRLGFLFCASIMMLIGWMLLRSAKKINSQ